VLRYIIHKKENEDVYKRYIMKKRNKGMNLGHLRRGKPWRSQDDVLGSGIECRRRLK